MDWHSLTTRLAEGSPGTEPRAWWVAVLAGLALAAVGEVALRLLFGALGRLARRTATRYDDHLIAGIRIPARALLVLLAVHLATSLAGHVRATAALIVLEWLLATFIVVESAETLFVDLMLGERMKVRVPPLLRQIAVGIVYAGAALAVLGHVFGVDVTPLLATTSVVSLVLGLALQQPLSNLFAGLLLHFDRPFVEGDWLLVGDREGQVVHIGWRSTRLRTFSDDFVVLPNNTLQSAEVQNFSAPSRITARNLDLPVPYRVAPEQVEAWALEELRSVPMVLPEPCPLVWLVRFEPACQRYVVKFWIEDFRFHDTIESDVLKALWRRFSREGVPLLQESAIRIAQAPAPVHEAVTIPEPVEVEGGPGGEVIRAR
ncbi:mechanosensitive ion channel family protein [Myxococcota bacterium]|nr:mechanosensitive ion channel family protein [Myxococcota bacterium]